MKIPRQSAFRVLTFDIENRPSTYWIPDRPTAETTAIAWGFTPNNIQCALLTKDGASYREMLVRFREAYELAGMVTGHYILRHDLPILNGAMVEAGLPILPPRLVLDTKVHSVKWKDIPKSQEHLCEMLGVPAPKVQMTQQKWREANRLTDEGLLLTQKRAVGDVKQHFQLRKKMDSLGLLTAPQVWRP